MNCNIFLLLIMFLYNSFASEITSSGVAITANREFQQETENGYKESKIQLMDLNEDVLFLILKELDLDSLTNMIDASPNFNSLAVQVFWSKFKISKLSLFNTRLDTIREKFKFSYSDVRTPRIILYDFEMITKVLKYFGSIIQKIHVDGHGKNARNETAVISDLINKYASKSLIKLDLFPVDVTTFEPFTVPFQRVEKLFFKITQYLTEFKMANLPFNQMFPNLRKLHLILYSTHVNYSFLECEMPLLEQLRMCLDRNNNEMMGKIEGMLKKNPQIRSIYTTQVPKMFIKVINKYLPSLEYLRLDRLDNFGNDSLCFEHVKDFRLDYTASDSIKNLWFPRLDSLRIEQPTDHFDAWLEFLKKHRTLTKLVLTDSYRCIPLAKLATEIPNLVEINFKMPEMKTEDIIQFIESHPKLELVSVSYLYYVDLAVLQQQFEDKWFISNNDDCLLFQKKN